MFKTLTNFEKAKELVYNTLKKYIKVEEVDLLEGYNKILAENIFSPIPLPYFNRAAMDGYAVRAEDTYGASPTNPIILNLVDKNFISENEAKKINTGEMLPEGANAVVMKEFCQEFEDFVEVYKTVHPNENVSKIGEDVKKGELILKKGEKINSFHLSILSSLNIPKIKVYNITVGVISTGDELVELGDKLENGKIVNSNYYLLYGLIKSLGFDVNYDGIVGDDEKKIKETIKKAVKEVDILITTGGTSVGERDYTVKAVKDLGEIIFHGINIRPGKPFAFGLIEKPVFLLSGYPVASAVQFELFIYRFFTKRKTIYLPLKRSIASEIGRVDFVRVKIDKNRVEPVRITGSGVITSLIKSDGYILINENVEGYEKDDLVKVYLF